MNKLESAVCENDLLDLEELARNSPEGCFVEVGVWRGGSAQRIEAVAKSQGRKFYAYDTFEGIPYADEIDYQKVGDFKETSYEQVRDSLPDTIVIKGVFPESAAVNMPRVAFAHIDCDQYRAIKESASYLAPMMADGGIMLFDDAGITFMPGATKAVQELFENRIEKTKHGKYFVRFFVCSHCNSSRAIYFGCFNNANYCEGCFEWKASAEEKQQRNWVKK